MVNRIAYVEISTYLNANEKQKDAIINSLKKADEIIFIDHNGTNKSEYVRIKRDFEKQKISVDHRVLQSKMTDRSDIPMLAQAYANKRENQDRNIYLISGLDSQGKLSFPDRASPRHIEKIIQTLKMDIERLEDRLKDNPKDELMVKDMNERIIKINNFIKTIENNKGLTYSNLDQSLSTLEKNLYSRNTLKAFAEKHLGATVTTTRKQVIKLQKEVKEIKKLSR